MAIHKLKKHQDKIPYFMLSREVVQGIKNPDSLAIWVYLQSQSDNWDIVEENIKNQFNIGRTRYLTAMKELRKLGLYSVKRFKDEKNNFTGSVFHIYAIPQVSSSALVESDTYIKKEEIVKENESVKDNSKKKVIDYNEIQSFWNSIMNTEVRVIDDKRKSIIKARYKTLLEAKPELKDTPPHEAINQLIEYVTQSGFLMGTIAGSNGSFFRMKFDWLFKPTNFIKVIEGNYHD